MFHNAPFCSVYVGVVPERKLVYQGRKAQSLIVYVTGKLSEIHHVCIFPVTVFSYFVSNRNCWHLGVVCSELMYTAKSCSSHCSRSFASSDITFLLRAKVDKVSHWWCLFSHLLYVFAKLFCFFCGHFYNILSSSPPVCCQCLLRWKGVLMCGFEVRADQTPLTHIEQLNI